MPSWNSPPPHPRIINGKFQLKTVRIGGGHVSKNKIVYRYSFQTLVEQDDRLEHLSGLDTHRSMRLPLQDHILRNFVPMDYMQDREIGILNRFGKPFTGKRPKYTG
jgi:hypothetical protein